MSQLHWIAYYHATTKMNSDARVIPEAKESWPKTLATQQLFSSKGTPIHTASLLNMTFGTALVSRSSLVVSYMRVPC